MTDLNQDAFRDRHLPLFDSVQASEKARVMGKIGHLILRFLRARGIGQTFTTTELYLYCLKTEEHLAPGSSCRILRQLATDGVVSYEVENRRHSKYKINHIKEE